MERQLKTIWICFFAFKATLGITKLKNPLQRRLQECLATFLKLSLAILVASLVWSFYKSDNLNAKIENGLKMSLFFLYVPLVVYPFFQYKMADSFLAWFEELHQQYGDLGCFKRCKRGSTQIFAFFIVAFPISIVGCVVLDETVVGLITGKLESTLISSSPFGMATVFLYIFHCGGCFLNAICISVTNAFIFLMLLHFIAILQHIQDRIKGLFPNTSKHDFQATIKEVVDLHCSLIEYQEKLNSFSLFPILVFETIIYAELLITWIVAFFIRESIALPLACAGNLGPYLLLCILNENLVDTFKDLKAEIYGIEWYQMSPKQRKMILQIMIVVDNPKPMRCGDFHIISYEELAKILKRVYNCGLFINRFYN